MLPFVEQTRALLDIVVSRYRSSMLSLPSGFPNRKTGTAVPVIRNPRRFTPEPKNLEDRST